MKVLHLDTNLLIALLDSTHPHAKIAETCVKSDWSLGCSSLAWMKIHSKPIPKNCTQYLHEILTAGIHSFGLSEAERSGEWFHKTGHSKKLRFDCAIAASAFQAGASLATANTANFQSFRSLGLQLFF